MMPSHAYVFMFYRSNMERKRLQLEPEPPDFPVMTITPPVPWRSRLLLAKSRIGEVLMITHPTVQALNLLWHQLYGDLVIVDLSKILLTQRPLDADVVQTFVKDSCAQVRDVSKI